MQSKPEPAPEHLAIVIGQQKGILTRISEQFQVTQSISPRVFLVRGDISKWKHEGEDVQIFSRPDIPEELLKQLNTTEQLFISAWQLRLRQGQKQRTGEGLNWDHPGFQPPR